MSTKELSGKDFLLALLYSSGKDSQENEPVFGRTKLTKMVYLFDKEIKKNFFEDIDIKLPAFEPYNFGPFSKDLFDDLSFFLSIDFIRAKETLIPISNAEKAENNFGIDYDLLDDEWAEANFDESEQESVELAYSLSPQGEKYVIDHVWPLFSEPQKQNLKLFKKQINTISLDSLLRYVYNKYPDSATKSLIANKYLE